MGIDKIAKAITAGLSAAAGMFWTLHADKVISGDDWTIVLVTLITVGGLTYLVPNAPATVAGNPAQMPALTAEPVPGATWSPTVDQYTPKAALSAFGVGLAERLRP